MERTWTAPQFFALTTELRAAVAALTQALHQRHEGPTLLAAIARLQTVVEQMEGLAADPRQYALLFREHHGEVMRVLAYVQEAKQALTWVQRRTH
jgi:hypothetical protein